MRPRSLAARGRLIAVLGRASPARATELATALQVSVPTLHRLLHEVSDQVVSAGRARRACHALRRGVRGDLAAMLLHEIDSAGRSRLLTRLTLVLPEGSSMPLDGTGWPVPKESRDGWWPGLPYPLYDMRPQGYLGRQLAQAGHRALAVSPDPRHWSDEDIVHVLSRVGADTSGNLILGEHAFERWHATRLEPPAALKTRGIARAYAGLAERALAGGVAGSHYAPLPGGEVPVRPSIPRGRGRASAMPGPPPAGGRRASGTASPSTAASASRSEASPRPTRCSCGGWPIRSEGWSEDYCETWITSRTSG